MKIEPSFCDHWKTKRLQRACGAEAVLGLLRLWGQAKIKRQYAGLELDPMRLAAVMDYSGDEDALWRAMTDQAAPWLDAEENGTWGLHGFAEHQAQIIRLWDIGRKGGRPAKPATPSPTPLSPNTSSSTSSSSSPICKPNENHMVLVTPVFQTPTLEQWLGQCLMAGIPADLAEEIYHDNEGRAVDPYGYWLDYQNNPIRNPISNAKARASAMARRRGISAQNGKQGHNGHNGHNKPESVWSLQQRMEAARREIDRIQANPHNKMQVEDSFDRVLKPEHLAKVKALKASISAMRQQMVGVEAVA
jgi:hypothetical protein